jgi:hypothetical protein
MSDDLKNENDRQSDPPFPEAISTAAMTKMMEQIFEVHEKKRADERHRANSATQKAVGIISLEQVKLADRLRELAEVQTAQARRLGTMEAKLDTVIEMTKDSGQKAETAAKTSGKTFVEQRVAIFGALGTLVWYAIEYFSKH